MSLFSTISAKGVVADNVLIYIRFIVNTHWSAPRCRRPPYLVIMSDMTDDTDICPVAGGRFNLHSPAQSDCW